MKRTTLTLCLLLTGAATAAFADCPDGARNTTEAEQAFYSATVEKLAAMIPAAPAGWELQKPPVYKASSSVCKGSDMSRVVYSVTYRWVDGSKEQNKRTEEMQKKVSELRKLPVEKAAEISELARQSRALRREWTKARAEKNTAEAERLEKEFKALDAKGAGITRAHEESVQPELLKITNSFLEGEKGKTYFVSLALSVNETGAETASKPGALTRNRNGVEILYGQAKPVPGKLKVQSVTARWTGDPAQAELLAASLDRSVLQSALQ